MSTERWPTRDRRGRPRPPAAARSSSAAGCATGCAGSRPRTSTSRCSAFRRIGWPPLLAPLGRVEAVGQSFPVYKVVGRRGAATIDVALPRRESKHGRGHKGFEVQGDPVHVDRRGRAPPRLHRQRDRVGSADRRVRGSVRRPRRPRRGVCCAPSIRPPSATTACACCARSSSRRASSSRSTTHTAALCRRIPLDDLPAERVWGEIEKLLLAGRSGRRSAWRWRSTSASSIGCCPELLPLVGCEQEPEWHPEGDVWVHTLMVIDKARELNGDLDRPRLITVMLGAVCHDLGKPATTARHRRPHPLARITSRPASSRRCGCSIG